MPGRHSAIGCDGAGDHDIGSLKQYTATCRHGIASVDTEVDEDLFELDRICNHRPERAFELRFNVDIVADQALQHALDADHHVIDIHEARLHDALARKSQ